MTVLHSLLNKLRTFRSSERGNVTMIFALSTLPIIGFVGAAVDYSHANSVRTAMQAALDSTALMLSKEAGTDTSSQLNTNALNYFKAMFNRPEATNVVITPTYTTANGSQVTVTGSANVPTNFLGVMGYNSLHVGGTSTVKWGNTKLRVSLVLDTTGSMADDGKMTALKTATKNLLNQLKAAATTNGDVYVSIIPFSKDVNVGTPNYGSSWLQWSGLNDTFDENNGTCRYYSGWSQPTTKSSCQSKGGSWSADNHNTWNGCVTDRGDDDGPSSGNYDTNVVAPSTTVAGTRFVPEQYAYCSPQIMPLSYDWTSMSSLIDSFYPNGNTNQGIGLAHGWMSLVGGGPYPTPPAEDPKYKYSKVIILLTDGLNTENRWYTRQSSIDARETLTCGNIKAAGITLYTIQVNTGGDPTSTLLQSCASTSDKFFLLTSANQIVTTFNSIGTALSNLRISK